MVIPGSSTPKSLKISLNFGMIQYMMKPTINVATVMTATGYTIAPFTFRFSDWARSINSANLRRMTSSAPPASPARIMLV